MTTPVPQSPTAFDFGSVRVARPVVSGGFSRWSEDLAFTLGHNVHVVGGALVHDRPAGRTPMKGLAHSVWVPYARSPGATVVRVTCELHPGTEDDGTQTLTATLPSGAAWLTGGSGGLDGTVTFRNPPLGLSAPSEIVGYADVSALDPTDLTLAIGVSSSPNSKGYGIRRLHITEVPVPSLPVSAAGAGWDAAATRPGRLVIDGGSSSPRGTQRLFHLLDQTRANVRQHFIVADMQSADTNTASTTPHWHREASSTGAINFLGPSAPHWYLAPRDLYAGATTKWKLRARYRTSNGTSCSVGVCLEAGQVSSGSWVPDSSASAQTLTLTGTSNAWAWASKDVTMPQPSAAGGMVRVWFEAKGPGTGQLLALQCVALLETEP